VNRPRDPVQLGCLTLLLLWALLGAVLQLAGAWGGNGPADNNEGGGRFAVMGILGFILYLVIFGVARAVRAIASRPRRKSRGFPVEPIAPSEESEPK